MNVVKLDIKKGLKNNSPNCCITKNKVVRIIGRLMK